MTVINFDSLSLTETTQLWNAAFSDYLVPIKMSEVDLTNRISSLGLSQSQSKVLLVNDQPAGIMLVGQQVFKQLSQGWIGGMGVHPDFRRQGLASELLKTAITSAKDLKVEQLLLEVIVGNERAEALYRAFGFEELSRVTVAHLELTDKWQATRDVELLETAPTTYHTTSENQLTPWQNRLSTPGVLQDLYLDGKRLGYLFYLENKVNDKVVGITLKQFSSEEISASVIASVFAEIVAKYGEITCTLSNFNMAEKLTQHLLANGFVEQLQQLQFKLNL